MFKNVYLNDFKNLVFDVKDGVEELLGVIDTRYDKMLDLTDEELQSFAEKYKDETIIKITEEYFKGEYYDDCDYDVEKIFEKNNLVKQSNNKNSIIEDKDGKRYRKEDIQTYYYDEEGKLREKREMFSLYDSWGARNNRVLYVSRDYKIDKNNQLQLVYESKSSEKRQFVDLAEKNDEFRDGLINSRKQWNLGEDGPVLVHDEEKRLLPDETVYEKNGGIEVWHGNRSNLEQPHRRLKYKDITMDVPNKRLEDVMTIYFTKKGDKILGDETLEIKLGLSGGEYYYIKEGDNFVRTDEHGVERKYTLNKNVKDAIISLYGSYDYYIRHDAYKCFENTDFQVLTEKHPDGTYREFNDAGILVLENLADGTSRKWDDKGRISEEILPDGTTSTWEYGAHKYKTVIKGNETTEYIDDRFKEKRVVDGNITRFYDEKDILLKEVDKDNNTEKHFYSNGNLQKEIFHGRMGSLTAPRAYYYDKNGKCRATEDWAGGIFTFRPEYFSRRYKQAMAENNQEEAKKVLILMCKSLTQFQTEHFTSENSIYVRNDHICSKITDLGNGKVIFGRLYEDRDWSGKTMGYSGIEWRWKTQVAIVDVENCGLVATNTIAATSVRDATDSKRDLWNKINNEASCFTIENGTLYTGLKAEDRYGGQWYQKSKGINIEEAIAEYDKNRAKMIKEITLNKIKEYKENQSSAEISDPIKDKIGMLRNILQDNVSKEKGDVKPKRSDADKKVIREAITEYLGR